MPKDTQNPMDDPNWWKAFIKRLVKDSSHPDAWEKFAPKKTEIRKSPARSSKWKGRGIL